jgi:hypothetical protein
MPDWRSLKVGDRVRLLRVPAPDLEQRSSELFSNAEMAGWTADTIEKIISLDPIVTIDRVDDFGAPWYSKVLIGDDGNEYHHSLTITDGDSWELVSKSKE